MSKATERANANENNRIVTVEISDRERASIIQQTRMPETFVPKGHEQLRALNAMFDEFGVLEAYQDFVAGSVTLDAVLRQFSDRNLSPIEMTMPSVKFFLERFVGESVPVHPSVAAILTDLIDRMIDAKMKKPDAAQASDGAGAAPSPAAAAATAPS